MDSQSQKDYLKNLLEKEKYEHETTKIALHETKKMLENVEDNVRSMKKRMREMESLPEHHKRVRYDDKIEILDNFQLKSNSAYLLIYSLE